MTLSNVFIGKKVVQQIYLNNALIYQANGWQPLPNTPQTIWTKQFGDASFAFSITFDSKNNMATTYYYNSAIWMIKIDPDGKVLWNNRIDTAGSTAFDLYTDSADNIYCVTIANYSSTTFQTVIRKIDGATGNQLKTFDITDDLYGRYAPKDIKYDNSYIYVLQSMGTPGIYTFDYSGKLVTAKSGPTYTNPNCMAINTNYIFLGTNSGTYQIPKNSIGNSLKAGILLDSSVTTKLLCDQFNNLYIFRTGSGSPNYFGKYSLTKNQACWPKITLSDSSYIIDACIDYQCNIYVMQWVYRPGDSKYLTTKYSADGQQQWSITGYVSDYAKIATDSLGNIYQVDGKLNVTKTINLVKKGS